MLVFNNQQRSGYEEIVSYSPNYYGRIKEMDAVFRLAGMFIDLMARDLESVVELQFVRYMDGEPLERLENFLDIKADKKQSVEERRKTVLSYFIKSGGASGLNIKKLISIFTDIPVNVTFDKGHIDIKFNISGVEAAEEAELCITEIMALLRKKIPVHILLNYEFVYVIRREINTYLAPIISEYVNVAYKPYRQNQYVAVESSIKAGVPAGVYVKLKIRGEGR